MLMITRFAIAIGLLMVTGGLVIAQGYGGSQPRTSQPTQPTTILAEAARFGIPVGFVRNAAAGRGDAAGISARRSLS